MYRFLIFLFLTLFLFLPNHSFSQIKFRTFAAFEFGGNLSLPADENYSSDYLDGVKYLAIKGGLGAVKPFYNKNNHELAVLADAYFKTYYTLSDIRLRRNYDETFRFNANYIGISGGLQYKKSTFFAEFQTFAAYMIYNVATVSLDDGNKEKISLSNKGSYAINYLDYGLILSLGVMFPAEKPRFGLKLNYPFSISKLYDGALDHKIYNNRWFSLCEIQLEYYF